jgi:hypothetical protein
MTHGPAPEQHATEGWLGLFKREYRWMMTLAIGLPLLQQASGINTVIYYSSEVCRGLAMPLSVGLAPRSLEFSGWGCQCHGLSTDKHAPTAEFIFVLSDCTIVHCMAEKLLCPWFMLTA